MSTKFSVHASNEGGNTVIKLSGVIDEAAHFDPSIAKAKTKVIIDFDELTGINSLGIRAWVKFINALQESCETFVFRNCRSIIIDQINMVADFAPKGTVFESFYAPYSCDDCNTEKEILFTDKDIVEGEYTAPPCSSCNETMEMDALEDEYFIFLNLDEG